MRLDLRLDMKYLESTSILDVIAMQYDLRTVGELYDFIRQGDPLNAADRL